MSIDIFESYGRHRTVEQMADEMGVDRRTIKRWQTGQTHVPHTALKLMESQLFLSTAPISRFTFIDLFAGIGGTRRGFEAAGGHCVFTSEWNKYAQQTYAANFLETRDHAFAGDITKVSAAEIPDHDVLVGGFPCQPFSIAGVSKKNSLGRKHGFADETQGTLFFDVARILEEKRPKAFLLENVRNLMSHDHGNTFRVIMDTLQNQLGYQVSDRVLDASPWVPQKRQRIFIAGLRDADFPFDFDEVTVPPTHPVMADILHPEDGTEPPEAPYTNPDGTVSSKYTLTPHLWQYLQDYAAKHKAAGHGFGFGLVGPGDVARTLSARYYKDGSEILIDRGPGLIPRRLTPRECARIMGFPNEYRIPVSDTQAYKQFGNSVVAPLVDSIAKAITKHL